MNIYDYMTEDLAVEILDYVRMIYEEGIYKQEHVDEAVKLATRALRYYHKMAYEPCLACPEEYHCLNNWHTCPLRKDL